MSQLLDPHEIVRRAFRQGFEIGQASAPEALELRAQLAAAERMADYWYLHAHYSRDEIDAMHRESINRAFESGAIAWLDDADPTVSWSEARSLSRRTA